VRTPCGNGVDRGGSTPACRLADKKPTFRD
jgi:hypothetical protein